MKWLSIFTTLSVGLMTVGASATVQTFDSCSARFVPRYVYSDPRVNGDTKLGGGISGEARWLEARGVVEKTYHTGERQKQAKADAANLALLQEITTQSVDNQFLFIMPEHVRTEAHDGEPAQDRLYSPFVEGRSVHDLLLDEAVPLEVKRIVGRAFGEKLRALARLLERQQETLGVCDLRAPEDTYYFADRKNDGLFMLEASLKRARFKKRILIKSDNVIVDPINLNRLTVIDAL